MKTAKLLKTFIDMFLLIFILAVLFGGALLIIFMVTGEYQSVLNVPEKYKTVNLSNWMPRVFLILALMEYILFITGMYFLKRSLTHLVNGSYYSEKVIAYFKTAGKLLVTVGITTLVLRFLADILLIDSIALTLDSTAYSLLFVTIMGLFFMLFSTVFANSKKLKEENDLTI